jgi:hypothetical protein
MEATSTNCTALYPRRQTSWSLFHLDGYMNKQNAHNWDFQNPDTVTDDPLHHHWITKLCPLSSIGILVPCLLKRHVSSQVYLHVLQNHIVLFLRSFNISINKAWLQDDIGSHTVSSMLDSLEKPFKTVLSYRSPYIHDGGPKWPPIFSDINPSDSSIVFPRWSVQ